MLKYILEKGYDINSNINGQTVINRSVHLNMQKMVEFLLEYNPDLEISSNFVIYKLSFKKTIYV